MEGYAWPGNLRELRNIIERAVILAETNLIGLADLSETIQPSSEIRLGGPFTFEQVEARAHSPTGGQYEHPGGSGRRFSRSTRPRFIANASVCRARRGFAILHTRFGAIVHSCTIKSSFAEVLFL